MAYAGTLGSGRCGREDKIEPHRRGRVRRRAAALLSLTVVAAPYFATAQSINQQTTADSLEFRNDFLYGGLPIFQVPAGEPNEIATAPGAEQQVRIPRFTFGILAPFNYNSNAESRSSGGTATAECSPEVRLGFAGQLFDLPLRVSGSVALDVDRYVQSNPAAFDNVRPRFQLQYVNANNDQAFSPFLGFSPRVDFTPTFATQFATRYDLNLGFQKAFAFDGEFHRLPPSGNSSSSAAWVLGFTAIGQRRFRDPAPASYAFLFIPSVSHPISENLGFALAVDITRRWFDEFVSVSRQNLTLEPVAALEYGLPVRWFGTPERARSFGSPAIDLFVGYEKNWSNISGGEFSQWVAGFSLKAAWRF